MNLINPALSSLEPGAPTSPGFFDVLQMRRSVRAFTNQPVDEKLVQRILAAANSAPSAGNVQGYEIVIVRDAATREALVSACFNQKFIAQAPVVLVFYTHAKRSEAKYGKEGGEFFSLQDATIACAYAELAIAALGLATVWIGAINVPALRELIAVPPEWKPVSLLPVGYRAEAPPATSRRPLSDLVHEAARLR
jgi:nitroreductase